MLKGKDCARRAVLSLFKDAKIRSIKRLGGIGNESYKVNILSNGEEKRICIKIFSGTLNEAKKKAIKEKYFIEKLSEIGFYVPKILHYDLEGKLIGRPFLIKKWIEGRPVGKVLEKTEDKEGALEAYTYSLVRLHKVPLSDISPNIIKTYEKGEARILEQIEVLKMFSKLVKVDVSNAITLLKENRPRALGLSLLFGDYAPENVLLDNNKRLYFIDLESIEVGIREEDVAYAYHMLCFLELFNKRLKGISDNFLMLYEHYYGKSLRNFEYFKAFIALKLYLILKYLMKSRRFLRPVQVITIIYPIIYTIFFKRAMNYLRECIRTYIVS